jgi:tetratricopeptide (TPR) repeat protein
VSVAVLASLVAPSPLVAQEAPEVETVEPSPAQVQLYEKAFEAFHKEDYPRAIELFRSALALGELNLLYLNLGRAHFRAGQCAEAEAAFEEALTAPAVSNPPPKELAARLSTFRADLDRGCPGALALRCTPEGVQVRIDDQGEWRACERIEVPAGFHKVEARLGAARQERVVEVKARADAPVELVFDAAMMADAAPGAGPWPWVLVGSGAALLGGALFLDQVTLDDSIEAFEEAAEGGAADVGEKKEDAALLQGLVLATTVAGGLLVLGGGLWWLLGGEEEAAPTAGVSPWLGPEGGGLQWQGSW